MAMSIAPSAAPLRHLKLWSNGTDIFVEIPGHAGRPPYITSFPYDTRGIALTLSLIGAHRIDYDYTIQQVPNTYHSNLKAKGPGTPEQQASADKALRLAGLLK